MRRLATGREAEIYEWGPGRVLRLLRDPLGGESLDEVGALAEAARAAGVATPALLGRAEVAGRRGQVLERVDGVDHFTVLARRPWLAGSLARELGRVQARMHAVHLDDGFRSVHAIVRRRLTSPFVPAEVAAVAETALQRLPDGDTLCHGALHPGNLLRTADRTVVIDWTGAARGAPRADLARTVLMLRVAAVADGTPAVVRHLVGPLRRGFARRTLDAYAAAATVDRAQLDAWIPVRAADRLADGVAEERASLLELSRQLRATS